MDEKKVREAIGRLQVGNNAKREMIKHNKVFFQKQDNSYLESDIEVYCTAIEALEKQLPKKTRENGMQDGLIRKIKYYTCPTCGNCLLTEMMNEIQNTGYCWDCGQRLDWSYQTEVAGNIFDDPELLEVE